MGIEDRHVSCSAIPITRMDTNRMIINIQPLHLTDEQFFDLCVANQGLRLERTARGEMIVMTPAGGETGSRNSDVIGQLWQWNKHTRLGIVFSSTGFKLPNGSERSPDASWVLQERWDILSNEERKRFPPLCPDFVVELRSPSDRLADIQEKMQEYRENGARLGWLIDPETKRVYIYRPECEVEVVEEPSMVAGEHVLPGFVLDLSDILAGSS